MYQAMARDGGMEEHGIRGVDFNSGSLGHGMSVAAGMALNAKAYGHEYLVYALMGDGDLQEGMTLGSAHVHTPIRALTGSWPS